MCLAGQSELRKLSLFESCPALAQVEVHSPLLCDFSNGFGSSHSSAFHNINPQQQFIRLNLKAGCFALWGSLTFFIAFASDLIGPTLLPEYEVP